MWSNMADTQNNFQKHSSQITSFEIQKKINQTIFGFLKQAIICYAKHFTYSIPFNHTRQSQRKSILNIHWKNWCWSWSTNPLTTWCKESAHWKRPRYCIRLMAVGKGKGDGRGWDGWMVSLKWTWIWANPGRWWKTRGPGVLQSMGLQGIRYKLAAE